MSKESMRRLLVLVGIAAAAASVAPAIALDPALLERINSESERLAPKLGEPEAGRTGP